MSEKKLGDGEPSSAPPDKLREALRQHWPHQVICDHEAKKDAVACSCALWIGTPQPSVGEAIEKWIDHVFERSGAAQEVSPPSLVRMKDGSLVHSNPCPKCGRTEIHKLCSDVPPKVDVVGVFAEVMEMAPVRHTLGLNHAYESGCTCLRCRADNAIEKATNYRAEGNTRELKAALAIFVQRGKMRIRELETMKLSHFGHGEAGELAVWRLVRDELEKL